MPHRQTPELEHFIPFRRTDIVTLCARDGHDDGEAGFRAFAGLLSALFHFEFHARLERMKDAYAPFNPDRDTRRVFQWDDSELATRTTDLMEELRGIIEDANYTPITQADLDRAMAAESLFKVRLHVNFDDFDEVLFFRRGVSTRHATVRRWFGLNKSRIEFVNYDRVVVYVRFRDAAYFAAQGRIDLAFEPGSIMLKLFQNVPEADLEMLFPNTEVRMKLADKLAIGIPAAVSGMVVLTTKLGATLVLVGALAAFWLGLRAEPVSVDQAALLALASGLGALGGYLWKQFSSFTNRKIRFMKALADSLYFKNLDNNVGVFHQLIDAAEEEESKEVILAYHFLCTRGPLTSAALDAAIEAWFEQQLQVRLDFEIADALRKLERLQLASLDGALWSVPAVDEARRRLDARWDALFDYA